MSSELALFADNLRVWRVQENVKLATHTMIMWYFVTTIRDEVKYIWPQPGRKLGKILYFTARISFVLYSIVTILMEFPTHIKLDTKVCDSFIVLQACAIRVIFAAAEAILWMCLYALLHGKKRHFIILAVIFTVYHSVITALSFLVLSLEGARAVPQSALDAQIGYSCTWDWVVQNPQTALIPVSRVNSARRYLRLAMLFLTVTFSTIVLVVRYRKQNGRLIRVIRREGGLHLLVIIAFYTFSAITAVPALQGWDPYAVANASPYLAIIFSDRLLLHLRKSDDPGTQKFMSEIVFGGDNRADSSDDDFYDGDASWVDSRRQDEPDGAASPPDSSLGAPSECHEKGIGFSGTPKGDEELGSCTKGITDMGEPVGKK